MVALKKLAPFHLTVCALCYTTSLVLNAPREALLEEVFNVDGKGMNGEMQWENRRKTKLFLPFKSEEDFVCCRREKMMGIALVCVCLYACVYIPMLNQLYPSHWILSIYAFISKLMKCTFILLLRYQITCEFRITSLSNAFLICAEE